METWFIIILTLCIPALLKSICSILSPSTTMSKIKGSLPPGPPTFPIIGTLLWLRTPFAEFESILRTLHAKYGPIITLRIGSRPNIFIADRTLAYQALVQNGAVFANRPPALPTNKIISSNQHNITFAPYGPMWRLFRRNLTSEMLHPSRLKSYSPARKWVLDILSNRLESFSSSSSSIQVYDHFNYAMFCLLVFMCFGDKVSEKQMRQIEIVQRRELLSVTQFNILNLLPRFGKILFRKRWEEFLQARKTQEDVLFPFIRARKEVKQERLNKLATFDKSDDQNNNDHGFVLSYLDTLLDLELPEEKRKLSEGEIVSLCSEFLNAGTDTTSTALQWIMANMVKYPHIQEKLVEEINGVVGNSDEVKEEDLHKIAYLKAVVLEGLRRHPPGHYVLPHAVSEDVNFEGYLVPKNGTINFMVAEIGWDPKVWEDPMVFKPERFLDIGQAFDITGSREIKMMPFGSGRRICPGYVLAMLHLEYFVANLVWRFRWMAAEGDDVDLSEKLEFTVLMKNPLKARLSPRFRLN